MGWRSRQGVAQLGVLHQLYHNVCARRVCGRGRAPSLALRLRADAVFAGDLERFTCASRAFLALVGPHAFMQLAARSKKQSSVSLLTADAELIATEAASRTIGLPALSIWG